MIDYKSWMARIREEIENDINLYLAQAGLDGIEHFLTSAIGLEDNPLSIAVYPTSSNGSSFRAEGSTATGRFTVAFYLNGEATEEAMELVELYYSSLIDFLASKSFGQSSIIDESVIVRMDDGEPVNGALFLIESVISSFVDYGW